MHIRTIHGSRCLCVLVVLYNYTWKHNLPYQDKHNRSRCRSCSTPFGDFNWIRLGTPFAVVLQLTETSDSAAEITVEIEVKSLLNWV